MKESNEELIYKYRVENDSAAYDKLVENNLAFIYYAIAKIFNDGSYTQELGDEYLGTGVLGLVKAINTYDINKKDEIKFITYASICIRNEILMELRKSNKLVKTISLDDDVDIGGDTKPLSEIIPSEEDHVQEFIDDDYAKYKSKKIKQALDNLQPLHRKIIALAFGFDGMQISTHEEMGFILDISQSYVSRLQTKAVKELAESLGEFKKEYGEVLITRKEHSHMGNHTHTSLEKIEYVYGKDKVNEAIKKLDKEDATILFEFNGVYGHKKSSLEALALLHDKPIEEIGNKIEYINGFIINECLSLSSIKNLNDLYVKYGKDVVDEELMKLTTPYLTSIEPYFGLNGNKKCSIEEISKNKAQRRSEVVKRINKGLEIVETNIISERFSSLYNTDKNKINKYISSLDDYTKNIVKSHFSIGRSKKNIEVSEDKINEVIVDFTTNLSIYLKGERNINLLYETLGKEIVDYAFLSLDEVERKVMRQYYNVDTLGSIDIKDIASDNNLSAIKVHNMVAKFKSDLDYLKENLNKVYDNDLVGQIISKYNFKEITALIEAMDDNESNILRNIVLERKELRKQEIAEMLNISIKRVDFKVNSLLTNLENKLMEVNKKKESILLKEYNGCSFDLIMDFMLARSKSILDLYYGINGKEKLTVGEIAFLYNMDEKEIEKQIENMREISTYLINDDFRSRKRRYNSRFSKYDDNKIKERIKNLAKEDRELFELCYGLNDKDHLQVNEICQKYNISYYEFIDKINLIEYKIIESLNVNKPKEKIYRKRKVNVNYYNSLIEKYGEAKVVEAFNKLDENTKNIINLCYGLDGNENLSLSEISEKLNLNQREVYYLFSRFYFKCENLILNKAIKKVSAIDRLFKDYGEDVVYSFIDRLKEKDKSFIKEYYGLSNTKKLSSEELAKKYDIKKESTFSKAAHICLKLEKIIKDPSSLDAKKKKVDKTDRYRDFINKYGESNIRFVLNLFDGKNPLIFSHLYGLDTKLSVSDVAEKFNMTIDNVYASSIRQKKKIEEFFNMEVNEKVKLNEGIIEKCNDTLKEIYSAYSDSDENVTKINDVDIDLIRKGVIYLNKNYKNHVRKVTNPSDKNDLIDKYGIDKVTRAVELLVGKSKEIAKYYYGLDKEKLTISQISKKIGSSSANVSSSIFQSKKKIIKIIESDFAVSTKKSSRIDDFMSTYGKDKLMEAIKKLNDNDRDIIISYYGIDQDEVSSEELAKKYDMKIASLYATISKILDKISFNLENRVKIRKNYTDKVDELINTYGKDKVIETINCFSKEDANILLTIFSLTDNKTEIDSYISSSYLKIKLDEIELNLEDPDRILKKRFADMYILYKTYGEEKFIEKIDSFPLTTKRVLRLYYGFDGGNCLSVREIGKELNIDSKKISNIVQVNKKVLARRLQMNQTIAINLYSDNEINERLENDELNGDIENRDINKFKELLDTYGSERVDKRLETLSLKEKLLIKLYYGYGYNKQASNKLIEDLARMKFKVAEAKIKENINKIEAYLSMNKKGDKTPEDLYNEFEEYDIELINQSIASLSNKQRILLKAYYGVGMDSYSKAEIAKKLETSTVQVNQFLESTKKEMRKILTFSYYLRDIDKINDARIKEYGKLFFYCDAGQLSSVFNTLDKEEVGIFKAYYGIGRERLSLKEIISEFNVSEENVKVILYKTYNSVHSKVKDMYKGRMKKKYLLNKVIEYDNDIELSLGLERLRENEKNLICYKYGLYGYPLIEENYLAQKLDMSLISLNIALREAFSNLSSEIVEIREEGYTKEQLLISRKKLFFKRINLEDMEKFKIALKELSQENFLLFMLYYGVNNKDVSNFNELCNKFNLNKYELRKLIKKISYDVNASIVKQKKKK